MERAWTYRGHGQDGDFRVDGAPAYAHASLYVPLLMNGQDGLARIALDNDGSPSLAWFRPVLGGIAHGPVVKGDTVYVSSGHEGETNRHVYALGADDGEQKWSWPIDSQATGVLLVGHDSLFVAGERDKVLCLGLEEQPHPRLAWTYFGGRCIGMPAETDGRVILALSEPDRLVLLDAAFGAQLWSQDLDSPPVTGPVLMRGTVIAGTENGVHAFDIMNGGRLWHQPAGGNAVVFLVRAGNWLACVSRDKCLRLIDPADGTIAREYSGMAALIPPLVCDNRLFLLRSRGFVQTPLYGQGVSSTWLSLPRAEEVLTPLVAAGSRVYFGTDQGLVCAQGRQ